MATASGEFSASTPLPSSAQRPPLARLIALAELYDVTLAALLARNAVAVPLIAAIDRAEEEAIASLAALLDTSDHEL